MDDNAPRQSGSGRTEGIEPADFEGFEGIYKLYGPRISSLCRRMTRNATEAEDLTQEVFLQLFRRLDTFRGDSTFYTWLHRLAVNVVLMRFRKLRSRKESFFENASTLQASEGSTCPREVQAFDLRLMGTLDRLDLQRTIKALPPGFRRVFIMHDIEGYEHNEICNVMGWSLGTSKSQLHRARLRLRALLCQGGPTAMTTLLNPEEMHE
ncbi:MAG: RNA polymerase sigma factor [Terriglobia bacterium]